ncbi:MAG TPA: hypothetical protein PKU70_09170 [Vicinamibacteria bacterium]|nr:hypothetical protein [Vicinamibacteria bacterium]HRB13170.1 hypothetical protein [Vicinamibacteria bacterium]
MKTLRRLLLIGCVSLPGCYDFDFPLDPKPLVPVDARLIGAWRCLGAQAALDDDPGVLRIARRGDLVSRWTFESTSANGSPEKGEYDVHGSTVPGGALLNALDLGEKANGKWNLVRYSFLLPDVLRIQLVNDEPFEKIKDATALRNAIEKRRDDPAIYSDFMICVRGKPASEASASPSPTPKS